MRRWHPFNRLRRNPVRHDSERCVLVVEELEAREVLSPVVAAPTFITPQVPEGGAFTYSGSSSFFVSDIADSGQNYRADLTAGNGTITVMPQGGLSVSNGGTGPVVTVVGPLNAINNLLATGVAYQPAPFFSGDGTVTVTVTDLVNSTNPPGSGTAGLRVLPVASDATLSVQGQSVEVYAPSSGFAFPTGFVSVDAWPDADGSETVTLRFTLFAPDAGAFTLSAGGVPLPSVGAGVWRVTGTSQAALQSLLDTLVLTPPAGYSGRADVLITADIQDQAVFASAPPATPGHPIGGGEVALRFFLGGSVTAPPAFAFEGGTIDLGRRYSVSDQDELDGDTHSLTLYVPDGTLTLDPGAVPAGLTVAQDAGANGTTIQLTGTLGAINQFLATAGSLTYTAAAPTFAGVVPLALTLTNFPGERPPSGSEGLPLNGSRPDAPNRFDGVAVLAFVPVSDHAPPSAADVTTDQDAPVALAITVPALADGDGSESVLVLIQGVPDGATLNRGTDLGGGQWLLALSDLAGLVLTPPPGASGVFTLVVTVAVTDAAPDLNDSDTVTDATSFTVTVNPAAGGLLPGDDEDESDTADDASDFDVAAGGDEFDATESGDESDDDPEGDAREANAPAPVNAYASTAADLAGAADNRAGDAPSAAGSLFAQVEALVPISAYGDKHPLPPVLPLDQTLPVAGFSDSGGDSFALIDKLYRDAAAARFSGEQVGAAPAPAPADAAPAPAPAVAAPPNEEGAAVAPVDPDAPANEWRVWTAAVAIVGALVAWAWLDRGSVGPAAARAFRRLVRVLQRRPTPRTV